MRSRTRWIPAKFSGTLRLWATERWGGCLSCSGLRHFSSLLEQGGVSAHGFRGKIEYVSNFIRLIASLLNNEKSRNYICKSLTRKIASATSQAMRLRVAPRGTAQQSAQGCALAEVSYYQVVLYIRRVLHQLVSKDICQI